MQRREISLPESQNAESNVTRQQAKDRRYCAKIERAVLRRAEGYQIPLKKTYKLKRVSYDPTTGKKIAEEEVLEQGIEEVHVPGDLRAGAYFLNNRAPDRWREHPTDAEEMPGYGGIVVLPEVLAENQTIERNADTDEDAGTQT